MAKPKQIVASADQPTPEQIAQAEEIAARDRIEITAGMPEAALAEASKHNAAIEDAEGLLHVQEILANRVAKFGE